MKTYKQLLEDEAKTNVHLDPSYTMAHMTVQECYRSAPDEAKWNDEATKIVMVEDVADSCLDC